jgi:hypothetical protein
MQHRLARVLLCVAFCLALARAQTVTPAPESTGNEVASVFGSVSGHVFCADTNHPARFATVTLQPAPEKTETPTAKADRFVGYSTPPATRTGLDGSFAFPKVKPGTYFLIADFPGYVSPVAKLSQKEIASKDPADIEKVEKTLVQITVDSNKDSAHDLELERGAAISGTIRYDDGSPANDIQIDLLRIADDGKMSPVSINLGNQIRFAFASRNTGLETDDVGHYRISGLPAGKYVIKATLPTIISSFSGLFGSPVMVSSRTDDAVALSVYSGNVFREKSAKPIEVSAGTERDDMDIAIPLLGLHTISGSVIALTDGHAINFGTVRLLSADDKSELRVEEIDNDGLFSLRFVPEGEYILRVTDAADTVLEKTRDSDGGYVNRTLHGYAPADLSISVHSDLSSLTINIPDKSTSAAQK